MPQKIDIHGIFIDPETITDLQLQKRISMAQISCGGSSISRSRSLGDTGSTRKYENNLADVLFGGKPA